MSAYESETGGRVLAISHNGNLSHGIMFPIVDSFSGRKFDRAHAETRARWEPLDEVTQIKGDGEAHPFLSPTAEFADCETWDKGNLDLSVPKKPQMPRREYARTALQAGAAAAPTAWRQSVQVRHHRLDRQSHGTGDGRGREHLRQAFGQGAERRAIRAPDGRGAERPLRALGDGCVGPRCALGQGEHPRGDL